MKLRLLLDYATFNFDAGSVDLQSISKCLAGDLDLRFKPVGLSDNTPFVSFLGLSYLNNSGFSTRPHRLQVSGVGCRHFEPNLPILRRLANNHLSRCDFAFDVVISRSDWRAYISHAFSESLDCERGYKRYVLAGTGEEMTVYIGKRKCAKYCRIYNKTLQDPEYIYYDSNGDPYELQRDDNGNFLEYVIRYEVELKRFKSKSQDFDPSYLFDSYFDDSSIVVDFIRDVWRLYGEDFLLPCSIDDLDLIVNYDKQKFCSKEVADQHISDHLYDAPRVFDSSVEYIASRFGKYIPFILINPFLRNLVLQKCEAFCGFKLDLVVSVSESGFYDLDDYGGDSVNLSQIGDTSDFSQLTIDTLDEGGDSSYDYPVHWTNSSQWDEP